MIHVHKKISLCTVCSLFILQAHALQAKQLAPTADTLKQVPAEGRVLMAQHTIDSLFRIIVAHAKPGVNLTESTILAARMGDSATEIKKALDIINDKNHVLVTRLRGLSATSNDLENNILEDIHTNLLKKDSLRLKLSRIDKEIESEQKNQAIYKKEFDDATGSAAFKNMQQFVQKKIDSTADGAYTLKVSNKRYRVFICDKKADVKIFTTNGKSSASIESVLKQEKNKAEMITNAGMFDPTYKPVGLLIENKIEKNSIDTLEKPDGNFYLLPNGVFFIDANNGFHVMETRKFMKTVYDVDKTNTSKTIKYATQSGPLLLSDGEFNNKIKFGSRNENIRSGVGVMSDGRAVFLISDDAVNFYQFALVFKMLFLSQNALYLDGAISKMYTQNNDLYKTGEFMNGNGGNFGPMISVVSKK